MFETSQTSDQNKPTVEEILAETDNDTDGGTAVSIRDSKNEPNVLEDAPRRLSKHQMENIQTDETIESLVVEHNDCGKVASEYIVRRFSTFPRAKAKGKNGFEEFCEKVKCKPSSSTTRKYLKIGTEADWLLPIADRLPSDWTTIYEVAVLGQAKAEELVSRGILNPQATAKALKAATIAEVSDDVVDQSEAVETIGAAELCVFQVDASDLSDQDRLSLYHALEDEAARHGCVVKGLPDRLAQNDIIEREAA
jgi:hypothetical protein